MRKLPTRLNKFQLWRYLWKLGPKPESAKFAVIDFGQHGYWGIHGLYPDQETAAAEGSEALGMQPFAVIRLGRCERFVILARNLIRR